MELSYIIKNDDIGKSINEILLEQFSFSNRLLYKLIKYKKIFLNGTICDTRKFANCNDKITVNLDFEEDNSNIKPAFIKLNIIYEDEWMLAINKPAGYPIHPSLLHYTDSISNAVKFYYDSIGLKKKIRPVNRLDLNTSGIVIFAKSEYIQECFIKQMSKDIFQKTYLCLVEGKLSKKSGTIDLPIGRKDGSIIERCIRPDGKRAITNYKVLTEYSTCSLLECTIKTGRTHQIRVHLSAIGHPIIGDTLYGKASTLISRQALHSYEIKCIHPITKKPLLLKAPIP